MIFLVAVDGSVSADRAFKRALTLMKPDDEIIVLTITDVVHFFMNNSLSHGTMDDIKKQMHQKAKEVLNTYEALCVQHKLKFKVEIAEGNPKEVICAKTEEHGVNITLIGQVGLFQKSVSIGSTSDYVIRNSKSDVLLVK